MIVKVLPRGGPYIRLWLPLGALRWRFIYRMIDKNEHSTFDFNELLNIAKPLLKAIRTYVRQHGHFDLVKIEDHEGTKIQIRI